MNRLVYKIYNIYKVIFEDRTTPIAIIFACILPIASASMAQEIHRPRFLVEGDPIPPAFYARYTGGGGGTYRSNADPKIHPALRSDEDLRNYFIEGRVWSAAGFPSSPAPLKEQFSHAIRSRNGSTTGRSRVEAEALTLPIISRKGLLLFTGPGYMEDSFFDQSRNRLPTRLSGIYWSLFGTGDIGDSYYWYTYNSIGSFSSHPEESSPESMKYFQISTIGWRPNDSISLQAGILLTHFDGRVAALPLAGLAWGNGEIVAKILLPLSGELRWILNDSIHFVAETRLMRSSYFVPSGSTPQASRFPSDQIALENVSMEEAGILSSPLPETPDPLFDPVSFLKYEKIRSYLASDSYLELSWAQFRLGMEWRLAGWTWVTLSALYSGETEIRRREPGGWYRYGAIQPEWKWEGSILVRP
jgi:hypothetical protein